MRVIVIAIVCVTAMSVMAAEYKVGSIAIINPWSHAAPKGAAETGVGYMTITNNGTTPDRLIGGMYNV